MVSLTDDSRERVWYFGIGSMMSPIALGLREVRPTRSVWCEILDHRKVFYAPHGMATLVPEKGEVAQAVAHEITEAELRELESREPPSVSMQARLRGSEGCDVVVTGVASLYQKFFFLKGIYGKTGQRVIQPSTGAFGRITAVGEDGVNVSVFGPGDFDAAGAVWVDDSASGVPASVIPTPPVMCPPSARYLELMIEGAKAVGMAEEELQKLVETPCTPRKSVDELQRLPKDGAVAKRYFSMADVEQAGSLRVARGMVFEHGMAANTPFGRGDIALFLAKQMRDPLHGEPPLDLTQQWSGWPFIEDMICTMFPGLKHIGWLGHEHCTSKL
mmetsp:Transcript_25392/g.46884  ORF Transcript_25392/g.46884 Transcript_25392/m.46884 type:complete len:330 (-) Transcript_25392:140-1129(-)